MNLLKQLKSTEGSEATPSGISEQQAEFERIKEQEKLRLLIELEKEKLRKELEEGIKDETKES
jgi:hypothetical protein